MAWREQTRNIHQLCPIPWIMGYPIKLSASQRVKRNSFSNDAELNSEKLKFEARCKWFGCQKHELVVKNSMQIHREKKGPLRFIETLWYKTPLYPPSSQTPVSWKWGGFVTGTTLFQWSCFSSAFCKASAAAGTPPPHTLPSPSLFLTYLSIGLKFQAVKQLHLKWQSCV